MKKFIIRLLILIVPTAVLFLGVNFLYKNTNHWKAENNVYKFNFVPDKIQLANLGSSHGEVNFIYDDFPEYTAFNFGISGQRHSYNYVILKQYINTFEKNAVVILPISYFEITNIETAKNKKSKRPVYYRFVQKKYMQEIDEWKYSDYIKFNYFPVFFGNRIFQKILHDITENRMNIFWNRTKYINEEELDNYCQMKFKGWTHPNEEKGEEGFMYNFNMVCSIIELCKKHDLIPVLVTTPITDVLNGYFEEKENFFNTFYRFTDELTKKYPDVHYFDYSHNKEFSPNHKLFSDGDHLNVSGAKKFTDTVIRDLKKAGILQ
ncbi:SGNH/GDSL hydrolase family protein [Treponema pedis]|uniref:SGNH/GDSL hydrolase family protein n=3 Tax=Treponema pedis TaxID=409322 RepID=S5ZLG4_9SPIR|nr:SGNH/GDSL hydrolase family protein [Treponema pedis]AGT43417.1 hypothetical protein TPE_0921 [Treponema pedis str. T A4]QSI04229.1 SGNH/GDSL hydrolase family protein [Treponema pedis]